MGPKQVHTSSGKTLSPIIPCTVSEAICDQLCAQRAWVSSLTLPMVVAPTVSLLGQHCFLLAGFLRWSMFLNFPNFWSLYHIFGFTLAASHIAFLEAHCLLLKSSEI